MTEQSPMRLVMVDDDPAIGDFVRNVAEPLGYLVEFYTTARDFEAAVAAADPAVVILDLGMPNTDGIELLRHLADQRSRAAIFIMSGFDETVRSMAFTLGEVNDLDMRDIIPKPVRVAALRSLLAGPITAAAGGAQPDQA